MRFARDGWAITSGQYERAGKDLPEWFLEEPEISRGERFIIQAFFELGTCRQTGMGIGPIPWIAIQSYAEIHDLDPDVAAVFTQMIRALDLAYLEHEEERRMAEIDKGKGGNGSK